ncbi:hypothetical protein [Desulfosediminicola flagellatus]|uniref:hypothetical protein n=1 Tax=Desulfosediminicola flagellatus TaxID=2569541 RepID=UPI0010AD510C|nr:hypothetical protein [Desulfosediminicola flagellatus]
MDSCRLKNRVCRAILTALVSLSLMSCSVGEEYAPPYLQQSNNYSIPEGNGISYRTLSIEDFHAPALPNKQRDGRHNIHAQSCIRMHVSEDSVMEVSPVTIGDQSLYEGRMVRVLFQALFEPSCSWWNPEVPEEKMNYVLQHEQVHFALSELSARVLSQNVARKMQGYVVTAHTYDEVNSRLNAQFESVAAAAMRDELKHHIQFDEDTSLVFDRNAQDEWLERVELRLLEEIN